MRILLQVIAMTAAGLMLCLGGGKMHQRAAVQETTTDTELLVSTLYVLPATETESETTISLSLPDVIDVNEMCADHFFLYNVRKKEMVFCNTEVSEALYPASITKLFSAWIALQILSEDDIVKAGWELGMLQPGSSSAYIALDSRLTVEMLIEGMLLPSGNDAALVLAAAVGRHLLQNQNATARMAVAEFVAEMNRAAAALGFRNSHFENPDGYHAPNHYSCPEDLARIATLALDEPVIARCMELQKDRVTFISGQTHVWENTNRLINPESSYYCPDAVGMKTGYTASAGYCLMAAFGEEPLVVGIFGGKDSVSRYEIAVELYAAWLSLRE